MSVPCVVMNRSNLHCLRKLPHAVLTVGWVMLQGVFSAMPAWANQPVPWQVGLQPAGSPTMERITGLYDGVTVTIILIAIFVLALLAYVMVRFNAEANPTPSKNTHNTLLEIIWTAIPALVVAVIAVPSLQLLYFADRAVSSEMTLKVVGHQWYWSYVYQDHGGFEFDSTMLEEDELNGKPRLLAVDNEVVLPEDTTVRILVTSDDVIHAWAVPSLGLKIDAIPGRVNETWLRVDKAGVYYGQCSELCGLQHGFMPVAIRVVSKPSFAKWAVEAREEFAAAETTEPYLTRLNRPAAPQAP